MIRVAALLAGTALLAAHAAAAAQEAPAPTPTPVRITMEALHQMGGVPPGWTLHPPAGDAGRGRALFARQGCHACHAVAGEEFPAPSGPGPELSGMGAHHPPAYFVEAILNPDAVLVDGPGYVAATGDSTMPSYPEMTLAELADVVAYLASLTGGGAHHTMAGAAAAPAADEIPSPPASGRMRYLVQVYAVQPGRLSELETWFAADGGARFLAEPGVLQVDTLVDRTRVGPRLVTVITFADEAALVRFGASPTAQALAERFDAFVGAHGHDVYDSPPLYRSEALSARRPRSGSTPSAR